VGLESKAGCSESRFAAYVEAITSVLGHADRVAPFQSYCAGLLLPGDRKSVEPIAARMQPGRVQAAHQSLHHFVAKADWSDDMVLAAVRAHVLPIIERYGPIRALIIDDTGIPKKGKHSVGVARQYCGQLGKQDNCQVAVSLSVANDHASLPIAYRLYLPHEWADDANRRTQAGVPDDVAFQTKPQIALDQLRAAVAAGIEAEVALVDAGYGTDTDFRDGITEIGLPYVVGIASSTSLWPPGEEPLPPKKWGGRGRPTSLIRRDAKHQPVSAKQMALGLPRRAWRQVTWREGTNTKLTSRFAAVRVRPAHRDYHRAMPRPEEWCLIEWPTDEPEPTKYFLSTLPANISRRELVNSPPFKAAYARAREMQAEYFVDELSLIADDGRNDFMRRVREHGEEFVAVDREHLERSKIRIGTRQWIIERILANKYGPKPQVVVNNQQNVVSIGLIQANSDRYCADQTCSPSH
jgi:SRSO17 transposase